jgi:IS5 family transposase
MKYSDTRIYKLAKESQRLAQGVVPPYSSKFSKRTFTQDQHIAILCIRVKSRQKLREMEELLINMPNVQEALGLSQVPDYSTMCRAMKRLRTKILSVLLYLAACVFPSNGKASIDATGFDKRHSSKHYVKRCKMKLGSMKTTFIIDTGSLAILGVHMTVTRKHDTQIVLPLFHKVRKRFRIRVLPADKGYDDQKVRDELRKFGVRPLIKHREYGSLDKAHNARMKKEDCGQRSKSETVNSVIKRKYDDTLHTKSYWNQCKEILLMAVIHNIERGMGVLAVIYWRISTKLYRFNMGLKLYKL